MQITLVRQRQSLNAIKENSWILSSNHLLLGNIRKKKKKAASKHRVGAWQPSLDRSLRGMVGTALQVLLPFVCLAHITLTVRVEFSNNFITNLLGRGSTQNKHVNHCVKQLLKKKIGDFHTHI